MSEQEKGKHTPGPTYNLTTINVQGDNQEAFEVYADESREQTIAFVFDKKLAALVAAAPEILALIEDLTDCLVGWVEIADKEDLRYCDISAIKRATEILSVIGEA